MEREREREIEAELGRLVLPKVKGLGGGEAGDAEGAAAAGEVIGAGAYGVVMKVEVNGVPCIAKRLHGVLVGKQFTMNVAEKKAILSRFKNECVLLSRLRHPNIVQFMGVHFGAGPYDLSLVMEHMYMDLDKCLAENPGIPAPIKVSILLDTSYGLLHLHSQDPPIVHRDLNAANILLTPDMRAKIADLGVSKILNPQQLGQHKNTTCPGAHGFMAPEALKPHPDYTTKLDCFSFGVVALFVANQEYPNVDETSITSASISAGTIQLQKRNEAVKKMGEKHFLSGLVRWCMQDNPSKRASAEEINTSLKDLRKKHPLAHSDRLQMQAEQLHEAAMKINLHALRTQLDFVSTKIHGYKTSSEQLKREKAHLEKMLADHQENLAAVETAFQRSQDVSRDLTRKLQDVEYDLEEKTREAEALRNQLENSSDFQQQLNDVLAENEKLNEEVRAKAQQVRQYKELADTYKAQVGERQREEEHATEVGRDELYEADKKQLKTQLHGARNIIAHLHTQSENLTIQYERLKEELRQITMENEDLRVQYDKLFLENGELKALLTKHNIPVMEAAKRRSPMQTVRGQQQAGMLARSVADPVYGQESDWHQGSEPGFKHGGGVGHGGAARLPSVDPESSAESDLMRGIDTIIQDVAADMGYRVESRPSLGGQPDDDEGIPLDPNLECITCGKVFRMGEIQEYKKHVGTCGGGARPWPVVKSQTDEDGIPLDRSLECMACGKAIRKEKYKIHVASCPGVYNRIDRKL